MQQALTELLAVILDHPQWEGAATSPKRGKDRPEPEPSPSLGQWECIYKGPVVDTPTATFGVDLVS